MNLLTRAKRGGASAAAAARTASLLTLLLLSACGGGGRTPPAVSPSVALTADPPVVNANDSAILTWSSSNATSCTASGAWGGSKPISGSETIGPLITTSTFTLSCTGDGGSASDSAVVTVMTGPDTTAPAVTSAIPAHGSANVSLNPSIQIVFSEDMDERTLTDTSFQLIGPGGPVSGSRAYANRTAIFTPDTALQAATSYTITVTQAAADLAGNGLAQTFNAAFTTYAGGTSTSACSGFYPAGFRLVSGEGNTAIPPLAKPAKGAATEEPTYKTCLVRVTDHASDADSSYAFMRNDYSRRQAFNADNTRLLIYASDGSWHLYDANTYRHIRELPEVGGDAEPQWHPTDPKLLYYIPSTGIGMKLYRLNVDTGESAIVADFASRLRAIWPTANAAWTGSEGSPSRDARYWAFVVDDQNYNALGLFTYDLQTDTILATYDLAANGKHEPDHVSMSPSGEYVVVSWEKEDGGPTAFKRDFTSPVQVDTESNHSDLALLENGEEVYVALDFDDTGRVYMANLATGARTDLFDTYIAGTYTSMHFSGKAYDKPGWVLLSTYGDDWGDDRQWMHYKVFAVQLRENPTIYQLAHHRSWFGGTGQTGLAYWSEPHASVNRDFTRVLFNSNWGAASYEDVEAYMIEIPPGTIGGD